MSKVCDECCKCYWHWENNDAENQCEGQEVTCCEYIKTEVQKGDEA